MSNTKQQQSYTVLKTFVEQVPENQDLHYEMFMVKEVATCAKCSMKTNMVSSLDFEFGEIVCPICMLQNVTQ